MNLRFLKSENLEKRLKGLTEIRLMGERTYEKLRFERWRQRTGKSITHWKNLVENREKPPPSEVLKVSDMKAWLLEQGVLQIILDQNTHQEIVSRSGPLLILLTKQESLFDENIVELIWKSQLGKHEEMVRTVYNLI